MSGTAQMEAEILRLRKENRELREQGGPKCRGCKRLERHPCGAFWQCPALGIVDPERDGCSRRI